MKKHLLVVGVTDTLYKKVTKALSPTQQEEIEPVKWKAGDALPPAATCALAGSKEVDAALKAATALGTQLEEVLWLVAEAIDCREEFRPGSAKRLIAHTTKFAEALGLSAQDTLTLQRGALIHDIGKLRVPNEILLKSDLLTYHEWATLQQHTVFGAEIVSAGEALKDTVDVVRSHHECFDGTGYPDGLEGDDIPYLARAMRILDVFCAMTSPRHYRQGQSSNEDALNHLKEERGIHFDPDLVDKFIAAEVQEAAV
jgi:putative nucleotidyltransferase with HDIG domain